MLHDRLRPALSAVSLLQATVLCALAAAAPSPAAGPNAWEWSGVPRIVAVGDLHGNHDRLVGLLAAAELIDEQLRWSGGGDHLVVAGDILDRGLDDRQLIDLLRRLESESIAAGGRVHVLLGNHEVMNLLWDLRYVNPASYAQFAPEESKADRKAAIGRFARIEGGGWGTGRLAHFNRLFPPGFFARQDLLRPTGEYGSWLMGLPAIVKINDVVYTHGGLTPEFARLGVAGINRRVSAALASYLEARQLLENEGLVSPVMNVLQVATEAEKLVEKKRGGARAMERRQAAEALLAAAADPILSGQGPLWYRGNALQDERLERDIVDQTLELLGARALVVAHSPTSTQKITSRFHDRLFRIDHGIGGSPTTLALVAEEGQTLVLDATTRETSTPMREFPLGQLGASAGVRLSDEALGAFLTGSRVVAARTLGRGSTRPQLIVLERGGEVRRGIFKTVQSEDGTDRYQHEVAAYRLDRALGLGMVPVTVLRTLDEQTGSLQTWVDGALDLETAEGYNLDFFGSDQKLSQLSRAAVFDALIGNAARKPADILGLVNQDTVLLIDHSKAFSTSSDLPEPLAGSPSVPAAMARSLRDLDRATVGSQLGELLSEPQIEALLERRDRILALLEAPETLSP